MSDYFSAMPAILTASAHSGISAAIMAASSSGLLPSGSTPLAMSAAMAFGSFARSGLRYAPDVHRHGG
jgi:hypothetical protein